jgi:hypothetical protein
MDLEDDGVFLLMRIQALRNKPPEPTEEKTELTTTNDTGVFHNFGYMSLSHSWVDPSLS